MDPSQQDLQLFGERYLEYQWSQHVSKHFGDMEEIIQWSMEWTKHHTLHGKVLYQTSI